MTVPAPKPPRATPHEQAELDKALKETFPASDPIAPSNITRIETPQDEKHTADAQPVTPANND